MRDGHSGRQRRILVHQVLAVPGNGEDKPLLSSCKARSRASAVAPHFIAQDADGAVAGRGALGRAADLPHEALFHHLIDWIEGHLEGATLRRRRPPRRARRRAIIRRRCVVDEAAAGRAGGAGPAGAAAPAAQSCGDPRPARSCIPACRRWRASTPPSTAATRWWRSRFALPRGADAEGVRRYGFHGLSYEYIARQLKRIAPAVADGRVVVAHLGSGATHVRHAAAAAR